MSGIIISGQGPGGDGQIQVFSAATGTLLTSFLPFGPSYIGSVSVAAADIGGQTDIVVGVAAGGGPVVKVFDASGNLLSSFFAFDPSFTGGVSVGIADIGGQAEIVVGAGAGGGPDVKVFDASGDVLSSFFAFDPSFTGGVSVGIADINGLAEIVAGAGAGGGPQVNVFDAFGSLLSSFLAFDPSFTGGVSVGLADVDGQAEIVAAEGPGGSPQVNVFDVNATQLASVLVASPGFTGGVAPAILCLLGGTRIATASGDVPVEALLPGTRLRTEDGGLTPLRWLGRSRVSPLAADPLRVLPIRIRAGALGNGLPCRDLLLSPGHALLLDGVLVHAAALVDGRRILREHAMQASFDYWHVECDTHTLVLAEGTPVESFLAGAEDMAFLNWADRVAPPEIRELPYPRCKSPRQLPRALRRRLNREETSPAAPVLRAA